MNDVAGVYECLRQGRAEDAAAMLDGLLKQAPTEAALHRARAVLAQHAGRSDEALDALRTAVGLAPDAFALHMELGQLLATRQQVDEAASVFTRAARLKPDVPDAWYLLGMSLYQGRRDAEALPAFARAHALAPGQPTIMRALAETHLALEQHAEALGLYERLIESGRDADGSLSLRRAQCLRRTGAIAGALEVAEQGVARFDAEPALWLEVGGLHEDLGNEEQAQAAYARAHALRPRWGDPVACLVALLRERTPGPWVQTAEALLGDGGLPDREQAYLHYVLGKREDTRGDHVAAARHWSAANALRRRSDGVFDREAYTRSIEQTIASFDAATLRARGGTRRQPDEPKPVFVLGVPRSGTTLVEQVLAAHPQVHGCGELSGIPSIAQALATWAGLRWPQDAGKVPGEWLRDRAHRYLRDAASQAPAGVAWLVDKQPYNVPHIGLLSMLFADARVVWCRRDPRDVALSIYGESFSPQSRHATDLDDIRFFMEGQERLMRHWCAVSPLPVLDMRYEDLVVHTETQSRRLLEFVGVPWDPRCLDFHAADRPVQTLSRWQVRQPVHARSVGRWRHYPFWFGAEP
ncbi:sulfotransferase [Pseudoxanthomonas sp. Root630]|uniref:tetratricopeptide repeat-containing sulfotransferase family protein n=1 Tax=Pseudoxanthomonas sp. Root630 TaxID=1736574 RepID=UPI000ABBC1DC|nr:sulfotransferase [Pseudoxanthomonas sp. Root630]